MRAHLLHDLSGLDALGPAWERLEPHATLPMQQFIWVRACAAALPAGGRLNVLALEDGGRTVAFVPLIRSPKTAYFELLGAADITEPMNLLVEPAHAFAAAQALAAYGRVLLLRRVPA